MVARMRLAAWISLQRYAPSLPIHRWTDVISRPALHLLHDYRKRPNGGGRGRAVQDHLGQRDGQVGLADRAGPDDGAGGLPGRRRPGRVGADAGGARPEDEPRAREAEAAPGPAAL